MSPPASSRNHGVSTLTGGGAGTKMAPSVFPFPRTFMTFTEAAVEVLRREGKPLHFRKIAEIAIRESLLDHVGKIPDDTMADQLAAHCRLPHSDRRLIPIQNGTFALVEWGMDEDPQGLENLIEAPPEDELPYRGTERHPVP